MLIFWQSLSRVNEMAIAIKLLFLIDLINYQNQILQLYAFHQNALYLRIHIRLIMNYFFNDR